MQLASIYATEGSCSPEWKADVDALLLSIFVKIGSVVFWKIKWKFGRRILAFDKLLRTDCFQASIVLACVLQGRNIATICHFNGTDDCRRLNIGVRIGIFEGLRGEALSFAVQHSVTPPPHQSSSARLHCTCSNGVTFLLNFAWSFPVIFVTYLDLYPPFLMRTHVYWMIWNHVQDS